MTITVTINSTITEDESGTNDSALDNNITALPSTVSTGLNSAISLPTGGDFFIKQYQPIHNDSLTTTPDDASTLLGGSLFVSATQEIVFSDFTSAPSGQDLWAGIQSPAGSGTTLDLLVTGINPNPTNPSAGDRVNVSSQGLGENSQALDHNEGVRIDFVNNVTSP